MKHLRQKKLSSLLEVAVRDLKKVHRRPGYEIMMTTWLSNSSGTCCACLAGSVLACELPGVAERFLKDDFGGLEAIKRNGGDELLQNQMVAINNLRCGRILRAHQDLHQFERHFPVNCPTSVDVHDWADTVLGRRKFYASMRRLVKLLRRHGL